MIKLLKKNKAQYLQNKIVNILMKNGKKNTSEKILIQSLKSLQKSTAKNPIAVIQTAIINSTSTFKVSEQSVKKGKRKAIKTIPSFILGDSLRITAAFKLMKKTSIKNKNSNHFYQSLFTEFLSTASLKSQTIDQKNNVQRQILMNKRYLTKFKW